MQLIPSLIVRTTTGTHSSRAPGQGRSMLIVYMEHSIQARDCDLIPTNYCWIPTAAALLFPKTTVVTLRVKKVTMQPQP